MVGGTPRGAGYSIQHMGAGMLKPEVCDDPPQLSIIPSQMLRVSLLGNASLSYLVVTSYCKLGGSTTM